MIGHVLLDADGVLQRVRPGADAALRDRLGEATRPFLERFWVRERVALANHDDVVDLVHASLVEAGHHDVDRAEAERVYASVWLDVDVLEHTAGLVADLRAAGYGVHLGTNQAHRRSVHMRTALGYDDLFDVSVYSCDVGHAKPDPAFFTAAAALIDAEPGEIVFVDDRADNVDGARAAGLVGVLWHHRDGVRGLREALGRAGVTGLTRAGVDPGS